MWLDPLLAAFLSLYFLFLLDFSFLFFSFCFELTP